MREWHKTTIALYRIIEGELFLTQRRANQLFHILFHNTRRKITVFRNGKYFAISIFQISSFSTELFRNLFHESINSYTIKYLDNIDNIWSIVKFFLYAIGPIMCFVLQWWPSWISDSHKNLKYVLQRTIQWLFKNRLCSINQVSNIPEKIY